MPFQKIRHGSNFAVVDSATGSVRGTALTESEADRMVESSYAQMPGKARRGSMNVPYTYSPGEP